MNVMSTKKSRAILHKRVFLSDTGTFKIFKDKDGWYYYARRAEHKGDKFISVFSTADQAFSYVSNLNKNKFNGN